MAGYHSGGGEGGDHFHILIVVILICAQDSLVFWEMKIKGLELLWLFKSCHSIYVQDSPVSGKRKLSVIM
jgi:hypothetical protein